MIFLELGFVAFVLHDKIRELSLAYYCDAFPFSIIVVDVRDRQSLDNHFQTPIFFFFNHSNRKSKYSIACWTIATINVNQQSIFSTIAIDIFNHQLIILINEIDIFDHQSTNSTTAMNF